MVESTTTRYFVQILCIFCFIIPESYQNRKYDVGAECLKLYKENFETVLARFHRSPEYVKILEDKRREFDIFVLDVKTHVSFFYFDQLEKKIAELAGLDRKEDQEDHGDPVESGRRNKVLRRQDTNYVNKSMVERLDSYSKLSSTMTVAQRNAMKDLGFQYAGHVIHALIKNMGKDGEDEEGGGGKSTNMQQPAQTTTEHAAVHTVITPRNEEDTTKGGSGEKAAGRSGSVQTRFQLKG
ncbi:hypothetical protein NE865_06827 [Phthorimaea operculella]|nr:hypothetical protein NE865_06827 [Phthorimaea operculella]